MAQISAHQKLMLSSQMSSVTKAHGVGASGYYEDYKEINIGKYNFAPSDRDQKDSARGGAQNQRLELPKLKIDGGKEHHSRSHTGGVNTTDRVELSKSNRNREPLI